MAQNPFDQLSKQYLEEFLAPLGTVQRQYEIPGEPKFVDVWFVPNPNLPPIGDLGLLGRIIQNPCLLEPYRNVPSRTEVRVSVLKLIWIQEDERRKARCDELPEQDLPRLWILAATTSRPLLQEVGGVVKADWMPGIYFLSDIFRTAIVAIDRLPETEETLWLRILGRGETQDRAIQEVLALPVEHPKRNSILRLLASWKVRIDLGEITNFSEQEGLMALSEAFLQWEQQWQQRTEEQIRQRIEQEVRQTVEQEVRQTVEQEVRQTVEQEVRQTQERTKQEERQRIAQNMLQMNLSLEAIASITELTIAELQQLQSDASEQG